MVSWSKRSGVAYDSLPLIRDEGEDRVECEEEELISLSARPRAGCTCQWARSGIRRLNRLWDSCRSWFEEAVLRRAPPKERTVAFNEKATVHREFPPNKVANHKYGLLSFFPKVLYEQFKFFLNLYFLLVAFTQTVPQLRINQWYTYWGPLGFVLTVTLLREAFDDLKRRWRDREINSQSYTKLTSAGTTAVRSSDIQVGDLLYIEKNQRVPADVVLLRTTEKNGTCFIRTDQLDGETDWKMRVAVPQCQTLEEDGDLLQIGGSVLAAKPEKDIYNFVGTLSCSGCQGDGEVECPLSIENTMWGSTVLASGTALSLVVYTGRETRSSLNTSQPRAKVGLIDLEINRLTKVLFLVTLTTALTVLLLRGFDGPWYLYLLRYLLLFSYIIPISLRVNLDMGKLAYSWLIQRDTSIPTTVVRCSTIPEELGRVEYLLTDKTGTLTRNEMVFRKLAVGFKAFGVDSLQEVRDTLKRSFVKRKWLHSGVEQHGAMPPTNVGNEEHLRDAVLALAICHNVTPIIDRDSHPEASEHPMEQSGVAGASEEEDTVLFSRERGEDSEEGGQDSRAGGRGDDTVTRHISYQASSPDEVALVTWTELVGVTLVSRELTEMEIHAPCHTHLKYSILQVFPFTSEHKRMGIIVKEVPSGRLCLYMKGADSVMSQLVHYSDWLEEECGNLAREGLRILVVGRKVLTEAEYREFETKYNTAKLSVENRAEQVAAVLESLERGLQLLCVTGVEDQLQEDVRPTLEMLRNAGIKVWMLTGDKLETAVSIARSSQLVGRHQAMHIFTQVRTRSEAHDELANLRRKGEEKALVLSGGSLEVCLTHYRAEFIKLARECPAVVCCRCSPTHKAQIVNLIKTYTKRPTCAVGDGGNDVSMIQAANVGVGIEGKEGKQASLAADFSVAKFKHIGRLLMWHGRNSYKRSASLSQFVIHRGLIITAMQVVFTVVFYFAAVALYEGILMVGYATVYTMAPVFSLVLDEDVTSEDALDFPELYKDLMKGRSLSFKTFFLWILISIYQGSVIMYGSFLLLHDEFLHVVAISFTALVVTELVMVGLTIRTWHWLMVVAELGSIAIYIASLGILTQYFDPQFLLTFDFAWKTLLVASLSCLPLVAVKVIQRRCAPPSYSKLARKNSVFRNCKFWKCQI